jgi:hypothetical protein
MRIIQSFNTFEDPNNNKGGFTTLRAFKKFFTESYNKHKIISNDNYCIYTDNIGYNTIKDIVEESDIRIIEFESVSNDRFKYSGKFQVASIQTESYIHVDLDLIVNTLPDANANVFIEEYSKGIFLDHHIVVMCIDEKGTDDSKRIKKRPHCGVVGFSNMNDRDLYLNEVFNRYSILDKLQDITYKYCIALEEILLQRVILDNEFTVSETTDCIHLRGNLK